MPSYYYQRFKTNQERFSEQYSIHNSGCWFWKNHICYDGYGRFWLGNRSIQAHRASWIIHNGQIPTGSLVLHHCDNRNCVNPEHLFLGTYKDNTQDMIQKHRDTKCRLSRQGTSSNFCKLTPDQVLIIFNSRTLQRIIAKQFGITQTAVSLIRLGKNWKWLTKKGSMV